MKMRRVEWKEMQKRLKNLKIFFLIKKKFSNVDEDFFEPFHGQKYEKYMRQSTQIHILFECFSSTIHCITFHFIYSLSHWLLRVDLLCKRKLFSIYLFIFISRWSIFFRMQMKWKKLWLLFTRSAMIFIPQTFHLKDSPFLSLLTIRDE